MTSLFDDLARAVLPTIMTVFGERQDTVHTNSEGDEITTTVIIDTHAVEAGDYGERMDMQTVIETDCSDDAQVGDTWTIEKAATDDDPYPDPAVWEAEKLLSDDGLTRSFRVRRVTP